MTVSSALLQLPAMIIKHGINVVEMPGWRTRQRENNFTPIGIIDHHDGVGSNTDNVPKNMIRDGQNGAQLWIRRNGDLYMLAAGRMWHAGEGIGFGDIHAGEGNLLSVGIETDYSGVGNWPLELLKTWRTVHHELAVLLGITPEKVTRRLCGHKEYAVGRKIDPANISMDIMRQNLIEDLSGKTLPPVLPVKNEIDMTVEEFVSVLRSEGVSGAGDVDRLWTAIGPRILSMLRSEGISGAGDTDRIWVALEPKIREILENRVV